MKGHEMMMPCHLPAKQLIVNMDVNINVEAEEADKCVD